MSGRVGTLPSSGAYHPARRRMPVGRAGSGPIAGAPDRELDGIRHVVLVMGREVDRAVTRSVCGLVDRDLEVCDGVIAQTTRLRALQRELRQLCLTTVLDPEPAPGGRREAVVLLHMAAELERIGDHCAEIARIGRELAGLPESGADHGLARMAEHCSEEVRQVLVAVEQRDLRRARARAVRDDRLEHLCRRLVEELAEGIDAEPGAARRAARVLAVARLLERIADRVVTVAEDLLLVDGGAVELTGLPADAATGR